jgi:predicted GH43/DUF377 family glycosyl hydrolase
MHHSANSCFHELFTRHAANPILTYGDWQYPVTSVFNPGAAHVQGQYLLLVRVEDRRGFSHLCAARSSNGISDWTIDPRPTFEPLPEKHPEEIWGIEDPRVTRIDELGIWAVAYTAYSAAGPLVSLATTSDFADFERLGPAMPPEDKDAAVFPVKFKGRYALLHRPVSTFLGAGAHVWISFSPDLRHWGDHQVVIPARRGGWWDANKIGLGPPPLQTPEGWLVVYHGVRETVAGSIYRLGLALLDLDDPTRLLRRSDQWVFGPEASYEREGDVGGAVFPCGWIVQGDEVRLYYGGADTCVALAIGSLSDLLEFLRHCPEGIGQD